MDIRGSDLLSFQPLCPPRDPDQHRRPVDTDQSPHQLSYFCFSGASGFPFHSLLPSLLPAAPTSLPPYINYSLSPVALGPSLCDPRGYQVREVRGHSPCSDPRHLSEVSGSVSEALRPCRATPTRPSGSLGRQGPPSFQSTMCVPLSHVTGQMFFQKIIFTCTFALSKYVLDNLIHRLTQSYML